MNHRRALGSITLCALIVVAACGDDDAVEPATSPDEGDATTAEPETTDATSDVAETTPRPSNTSCAPWSRPLAPYAGKVVAWPAEPVTLAPNPVAVVGLPNVPGRYVAADRDGKLVSFNATGEQSARVALDLATESAVTVVGFTLHADFPATPYFFVLYRDAAGMYQLARLGLVESGFVVAASSPFPAPPTTSPGGWIGASPIDHHLYVAVGANPDVGSASSNDNGFGKIWRVDFDGALVAPADNPFLASARPLNWSLGFNDPSHASFDRATGELWVADRSTNAGEINVVSGGLGYGAPCFEGPPADPSACGELLTSEAPRLTLDLVAGGPALVGGYVYRGAALPGLIGTYVFGQRNRPGLWGLVGGNGPAVVVDADAPAMAAFSETVEGELIGIGVDGKMWQLVADDPPPIPIPSNLGETGCFVFGQPDQPMQGVVPYDILVELWSDGAAKQRYFAIPDGAVLDAESDGDITLPEGSVLIKTFARDDEVFEVRFLVRHDDGDWGGYTYAQIPGGFELMPPEGGTRAVGGEDWSYPSRADCLSCHTAPTGVVAKERALGLRIQQLDFDTTIAGTNDGVTLLDELVAAGYFDPDDRALDLEHRVFDTRGADGARAYLDVNCAHCHQPGGPGRGPDLRFTTPFASAKACNAAILGQTFGLDQPAIIVPGSSARSLLSHRMHIAPPTPGRMPWLGTVKVDPDGTALVDAWIDSLTTCPSP